MFSDCDKRERDLEFIGTSLMVDALVGMGEDLRKMSA